MVKMDIFEEMQNEQICCMVDSWIRGRNGERNRKILKMRLIDGLTFEALAESMDMSVAQIKRIVYKGIDMIHSKHK